MRNAFGAEAEGAALAHEDPQDGARATNMKPTGTTDTDPRTESGSTDAAHVDADTARERLARAAALLPDRDSEQSTTGELAPDLETLAEYQGEAAEASRDRAQDGEPEGG
jgi:hypothetical protein